METERELHIALFPWFAFGHINPFVQLANKLSSHGVRISFLSAPGNIPRIKTSLNLTPTTQIISLPIPLLPGLPPGIDSTSDMKPAIAELLKQALDLMQPQMKTLLANLKPHFVFFDFAHHWMPLMASELGIKTLFFSVFSATAGAYFTNPARISGDRKNPTIDDLKKPPSGFPSTSSVTSLKEFEARDFLYLFKSFNGSPSAFDRALECFNRCNVILIKTCNEIEGPYVDFLKTQFKKPVLVSGLLVPKQSSAIDDILEEKWANWLNQFPPKSVVFCNFGSETFLTKDQIKELALGLELTGLPFFLVLNFPADVDGWSEVKEALPEGFMERVKGKGVVHIGWVQQGLILAHKSVGCYVNHSGFSSVIEGMMNDCQLVLLPLKGDQFMNAKLFGSDLRAGVEVVRRENDGYFGRDDVKEAVRSVMVDVEMEPGKSVRRNHEKWRDYLVDEEIQDKFVLELLVQLKSMV